MVTVIMVMAKTESKKVLFGSWIIRANKSLIIQEKTGMNQT